MSIIRLLILDVDGVLTSGELPYDADGNLEKAFFVQDGGMIRLWQRSGGLAAIVSGRSSPAVTKRAEDLGIRSVHMAVTDKMPVYEAICREMAVRDEEVSFMGDDLLDIAPMRRCGYPIAPANAVALAKRAARYVTRRRGGEGAVREAIERLMRHNGTWSPVMQAWLEPGKSIRQASVSSPSEARE